MNFSDLKPYKKIGLIAVLSGIILLVTAYYRYSSFHPSTDNAYVQANIVNIAPQITGSVIQLNVVNYQRVQPGELLFRINPEPFKIALEKAQAELQLALQQVAVNQDAVTTAQAIVKQRQAEYNNALTDSNRAIRLAKQGVLARQTADDAKTKIYTTQAALQAAQAQLQQAQDQLGLEGSQNATIQQAKAAVANATLDLSYTNIYSPTRGTVENLSLRVGDVVTAATPLFAVIDKTQWWINANYKETDIQRIRPQQTATVELNMYPGKVFHGVVRDVSTGSGTTFSLLPPENATGNWVKVTQRFPVKIALTEFDTNFPFRVGASATVTVDTRSS